MKDPAGRLAELAAISDADAAQLVSPEAGADLAARITATGPGTPQQAAGLVPGLPAAWPSGGRGRRRLLTAASAAVAFAAAVLLLVAFGLRPGGSSGHPGGNHPGRPTAKVLAFIRRGGYLTVVVRNPYADPARYRAEFRAHHLNITLRLVAASPSLVGTVVYFEGNSSLKVITAHGRCFTGGGGETCPIGFRVPVHYRGSAALVFGRPARAGEKYETTAPATAKGEALYGLPIDGRRVGTVLRLIRSRHQKVAVYNITTSRGGKLVHHVPLSWFVYEADPWAPGQVMLFADPTRRPPPVPTPSSGQPQPTATRAAGHPEPTSSPSPSS